jgi:asparagine synthase (glutamine-hydrolysing)
LRVFSERLVDRSGVHKRQWWDLQSNPVTDDRATAKRRVRELLDDATRLRMIADVPLCGMLSGGLDSSVLCALMAKHADGPIRTYSTAFQGQLVLLLGVAALTGWMHLGKTAHGR